jgi:predicted O-methyltransferase YrrM
MLMLSHDIRKRLARMPLLGRTGMMAYRLRTVLPHAGSNVRDVLRWLWTSKEYTNYTYDLTDLNQRYLAALVATVTGVPRQQALTYIRELAQDEALADHIRRRRQSSDEAAFADAAVHYGRRLGWYAFVRITRPQVVIETGVDKGLGACVLTAALRRNADEGHPGRYYGTDINPEAGYLLGGPYAEHGEILYGDSLDSLRSLDVTVDLFINDSDHSAAYEAREYDLIEQKLSPRALVVGDNAHVTGKLLDFADRTGRAFLFFREEPVDHWYPGAGIGVAYPQA